LLRNSGRSRVRFKVGQSAFDDFGASIDEGEYVVVCMTLRGRLPESGDAVAIAAARTRASD
jgi:hypothetical protein